MYSNIDLPLLFVNSIETLTVIESWVKVPIFAKIKKVRVMTNAFDMH